MLREKIISEWNAFKKKIIKTLTQLKEQVKQSINPEVLQIEQQIMDKLREKRIKEAQMDELSENITCLEENSDGEIWPEKTPNNKKIYAQRRQMVNELAKIEGEKDTLTRKLEAIFPLRVQRQETTDFILKISEMFADVSRITETSLPKEKDDNSQLLIELNHLHTLQDSLKHRESENKDYISRIERAEEKQELTEKKLELVRDLLVTNKLTKLQTLFTQGKI